MAPYIQTLVVSLAVLVAIMTLLWLGSLAKRDASIIDPIWGAGFVLVAWLAWWLNHPVGIRAMLLTMLTTIWGVRLSMFLLWRNWGEGEDRRYQVMRKHHGPRFWWVSLFTVFVLQAILLWFVSMPIQIATSLDHARPLDWLDGFGVVLWAIGFAFEAIGDWQLARFKADPLNAGRVMDRGLWRFTRHPNYFGDFCVWWGLYLVAAAGGAWMTVLSPLLMSLLLMKVSGAGLLERTISERRPDYVTYIAHTNAFFPGPSRARHTTNSLDTEDRLNGT